METLGLFFYIFAKFTLPFMEGDELSMLTIDLCEVRYAIIPAAYADGEIMRRLSYALNELSDLLPPYLIHMDGDYAYVYFAYEPSKRSLELVNGWMGTYGYIDWNIRRDDLA